MVTGLLTLPIRPVVIDPPPPPPLSFNSTRLEKTRKKKASFERNSRPSISRSRSSSKAVSHPTSRVKRSRLWLMPEGTHIKHPIRSDSLDFDIPFYLELCCPKTMVLITLVKSDASSRCKQQMQADVSHIPFSPRV